MPHHDLPFDAEYAKSGRASCKGCKGAIAKDTLRLAIMVQSPMFDGKVPNWYHFACFWKRGRCTDTAEVHGFEALRWEDQQKIKEKIGGGGAAGGDAPEAKFYEDYATEYAKSNRSTCRGCEDKIEKDCVRVSRKDYETQRAKMYGPQDLWHHVDCFVENREDLGFNSTMQPDKIKGFKLLKKDDRDELIEKLGKGEKRKAGAQEKGAKKQKTKETAEEKPLREQSQLIWKIRDELSKAVANNALKGLLEYNSQNIPSGESKLLDRVSDIMAFGVLEPCPECKEGQLAYTAEGYRCTGNITSWTKCMYVTQKPKRKACKVPKEFHDVEFLKKYKYTKRERVFPKTSVISTEGPVSSAAESSKPLYGMKFVIIGKTPKPKAEIEKIVTSQGGEIISKVDKNTAACISTKATVEKEGKPIKDAKKHSVHVVSVDFLEGLEKGNAINKIKEHSICDWGSDPASRIGDAVDGPGPSKSLGKSLAYRQKQEEKMFTKSVPSTMKLKVKGGAAVDPASGLENSAHVLQEKGGILSVVLGMVDIVRGTNSYYKLQLLESDKNTRWWVFRSWGRVGTTIGGDKTEKFHSKNNAVEEFKRLYGEKTGNDWEDRKNFVKHPNKFYPLEIDYGADDEEVKKLDLSAGSNSKLTKPVQDLVRMLFDVESMKKAMLEFEIDLKKMPLGKLSKRQMEQAYSILTELQELVDNAGTQSRFLDASNRFYTLIPHDFGMKKPPLLDTADIIRTKTEMLDNLLEIEVAYSLMKGGGTEGKDPIDAHYEKLNTKIQVVGRDTEEFKRIEDYTKNTHAKTHDQYDLEIMEVYKVDRTGEAARYRPFRDLNNKQLLWHGSRTTNFAGILSQGLRIAPPEAPVTGYMFGKGIYFADMVSKSANYCRTSQSDPVGLLMLAEVALGNMYECTRAEYVSKLPKGKHSTKGVGLTSPDPSMTIKTEQDVEIPLGTPVETKMKNSSLLYNEYIVYDVAQVRMKYLIKTNFKFKNRWF